MALLLATWLTRHPSHGQTPGRPSNTGHAMDAPAVTERRVRQRWEQQDRAALRFPFPRGLELRRPGRWPRGRFEQECCLPLGPVEVAGRDRLGKAPFCGQILGAAPYPPHHHPGQAHNTDDQHGQDQGEQRRPQEHASHQQPLLTRSGGAW
jgi:hypothetical protein